MCILCVTSARFFAVIGIVADDNDTLVGALSSELASGTSRERAAVGTGRVRWDVWTGRVQSHHRQVPTGVGRYVVTTHRLQEEEVMTEEVLIFNYVINDINANVNLQIALPGTQQYLHHLVLQKISSRSLGKGNPNTPVDNPSIEQERPLQHPIRQSCVPSLSAAPHA